MANIKSQKKRIITAEKARQRNKAVRSELKTAIKAVRAAVEANDVEAAQAAANKAGRLLDKAASKGIIHTNHAAQRTSGAPTRVNSLTSLLPHRGFLGPRPWSGPFLCPDGCVLARSPARLTTRTSAKAVPSGRRRCAPRGRPWWSRRPHRS